MRDQIQLLKTRRFLPLFVTQFFGAFNDNAFKNAFLIWFTYDVAIDRGLDAPMMVTIAAGLFILPFFLFSATAGQLADKYEKSLLTQKIKLAEILLMIACAVCFFAQSIYGLLTVLFLMGVQSSFFGPIKYSLLPEHLHDDELISGNGLIEGGTFLAILLGTIVGALIIRTEYGVTLLSLCVIVLAIIGWIASRSIPRAPIGESGLKIGWNIAAETKRIIGYAREKRTVWLAIIGISWFWLVGATFLTQFPTYTKQVIGGDEQVVTLFLILFSIGIGIGSVWCNRLLKGEISGRLIPHGSIGMTLAILLFVSASYLYLEQSRQHLDGLLSVSEFIGVGSSSWGIVTGLFLLSVGAGLYVVPLYAIMQHHGNERYLARIVAANNVMNALFMVLASLAALVLFSLDFTVTQILLAVGLLNIVLLLFLRRLIKGQRVINLGPKG